MLYLTRDTSRLDGMLLKVYLPLRHVWQHSPSGVNGSYPRAQIGKGQSTRLQSKHKIRHYMYM